MLAAFGSITSANATMALTVAGLFSAPQQIQQFGVEDFIESDAIENKEVQKGVDNYISAGWLPTMPKVTVTLQANSPSNSIFDQWFAQEQADKDALVAQAIILYPGIKTQFSLTNAYLMSYIPLAAAKKVLQPRKFILQMDEISIAPM